MRCGPQKASTHRTVNSVRSHRVFITSQQQSLYLRQRYEYPRCRKRLAVIDNFNTSRADHVRHHASVNTVNNGLGDLHTRADERRVAYTLPPNSLDVCGLLLSPNSARTPPLSAVKVSVRRHRVHVCHEAASRASGAYRIHTLWLSPTWPTRHKRRRQICQPRHPVAHKTYTNHIAIDRTTASPSSRLFCIQMRSDRLCMSFCDCRSFLAVWLDGERLGCAFRFIVSDVEVAISSHVVGLQ